MASELSLVPTASARWRGESPSSSGAGVLQGRGPTLNLTLAHPTDYAESLHLDFTNVPLECTACGTLVGKGKGENDKEFTMLLLILEVVDHRQTLAIPLDLVVRRREDRVLVVERRFSFTFIE